MTSENMNLLWQGNLENMNYHGNGLFASSQVSAPLGLIRGGDTSPDGVENISDMNYTGLQKKNIEMPYRQK